MYLQEPPRGDGASSSVNFLLLPLRRTQSKRSENGLTNGSRGPAQPLPLLPVW